MNIQFKIPTDKEFQQICGYIHEFELDNRVLLRSEFTAAFLNNELVGFARLREHYNCIELCSLGVVIPNRRQGIGRGIVKELINKMSESIYLVCIIPEFFSPFGFNVVNKYPAPIQDKLDYCLNELIVPETYVVMKLLK